MPPGRGGDVKTIPTPGQFCSHIKRPPIELNDRHIRSHGKIGDFEQSRWVLKWQRLTGVFFAFLENFNNNFTH